MYNSIPFYPVFVPAGFPSPAADYIEEEIDLNKFSALAVSPPAAL